MSKRPRFRCSFFFFVLTFIFFFLPVSCGKQLPLEPVNSSSDNPFAGLNVVGIKTTGDASLSGAPIQASAFITRKSGGTVNLFKTIPLMSGTKAYIYALNVVSCTFPRRALPYDTTISITMLDSDVFDWILEPHGINFDKTVEMKIDLAGANLPEGINPATLTIYYLNTSGDPEPMPTQYDSVTNTLTVELQHFSRYALVTG